MLDIFKLSYVKTVFSEKQMKGHRNSLNSRRDQWVVDYYFTEADVMEVIANLTTDWYLANELSIDGTLKVIKYRNGEDVWDSEMEFKIEPITLNDKLVSAIKNS